MTISAVISAIVCASIVIGYGAGVEIDGERPNIAQVIAPLVIFGVMAWGLWNARYWAVLGFQTVLLFALIGASLSLVLASEWTQAIGNVLIIARRRRALLLQHQGDGADPDARPQLESEHLWLIPMT